ncbi:MAG: HAD-IB family hydrolase [Akkermansia sp.]|nr:HAD-IB family hydrolase [Akkermansia sp.]
MIALFDMDGTLFAGDSQLRFARWILKRHGWRRLYLLIVLPCGILRALRILNTEQMKRIFLSYAWGLRKEALQQECQAFVQQEILPAIYPPLRAKIAQHHAQGDTTVLCSASPDWWTQLVGPALGFTHTIGTPVEMPARIPFFPRIEAPGNNKGANKNIRLHHQLGIDHADIGYTDSRADLPMLSICDAAVLVNPDKTVAAAHPQAEILTPAKGIGKLSFLLSCLLGI